MTNKEKETKQQVEKIAMGHLKKMSREQMKGMKRDLARLDAESIAFLDKFTGENGSLVGVIRLWAWMWASDDQIKEAYEVLRGAMLEIDEKEGA